MPPFVPAIIDQSIILNLGFDSDCPLFVPEKENRVLGIILGNEKTGKIVVVVNTNDSQ